ncbi:hypothetical protein A2V82_08260 [candidate division KSB1 bacterium RBG_16_48_16]|nr:MAG: hypothetical protein A2V82_08260 [candidate division KSB1 bacterium RBG_16_48_16]
MKAVKAYIRTVKVNEVVQALEETGVCDMTVIDVMAVGRQADPKNVKFSIALMERYAKVAKLEIVCNDDQIHRILEILRQAAYTGQPGDGIIYVTPVEMAVKIRTGAVGEEGLL